ncbi:ribonucleoside-triphosphate reductase, adenosylcobalamin-dependent [Georgenia satyanarayanai]|uniref:ribonucleoside-triphosphate reductase (thioredoxin) n=1 Tax=Georgenia satyanarayanai TaxID=860221 RepID=A0A2Y9A4U1_9MICO|nr:fused protease/ribonucleoside-triphosphate reductase [Georgenia satyanarayanai]PYG02349.1 adenosylcobalamin-dependent ribonucleoside-triphosphate reductase [Georgenia satyanarayanai]SSA37227.1 ribonucleoside-triphosphate reductase, adenosylcobalamin-dependent [Georgenia satyanarayanai]
MLSFQLPDPVVAPYAERTVPWGYADAAGNSLGEITFLRTYSRQREDGTKERWHEVCRRVVEGMFSILKDHMRGQRLPWDEAAAQETARDAYERLFELRWTPPGRGLWVMGTPLVNALGNSAPLQNCAFVSTDDMTAQQPSAPFTFLMEASMLGVGVGFDTAGARKGFTIHDAVVHEPLAPFALDGEGRALPPVVDAGAPVHPIPDTRAGWVDSTALVINAFLRGDELPALDYSAIRPKGAPIRTFGGTAAGPEPLHRLHTSLRGVFAGRGGQVLTTRDIADVGNLIGVCVGAGNVRRSAEILLGEVDDPVFLDLKNPEVFPERNSYDPAQPGWAWMSNNSVVVETGTDLAPVTAAIARNGEPGVIWIDTTRSFGRLSDPADHRDWRAAGYNPCAEQPLESFECCTLVETFPSRAASKEDYLATLKVAFLYGKAVTLLPTHWEATNAVMQRNRRVGTSMSGIADFADNHGLDTVREWMDEGYRFVRAWDTELSETLAVRESIRTTTVKPSGTVSIVAGVSPGVHWAPGGTYFNRAIRFRNEDPLVTLFRAAGYRVEPAVEDPAGTSVIFFPVRSAAHRSDKDVPLREKAELAALAQAYWSDNSVSVTLSFDPETEGEQVGEVLRDFSGRLKTASFLPQGDFVYPQMPYTQITEEEYEAATRSLVPAFLDAVYDGDMETIDAIGEAFCDTGDCELDEIKINAGFAS